MINVTAKTAPATLDTLRACADLVELDVEAGFACFARILSALGLAAMVTHPRHETRDGRALSREGIYTSISIVMTRCEAIRLGVV